MEPRVMTGPPAAASYLRAAFTALLNANAFAQRSWTTSRHPMSVHRLPPGASDVVAGAYQCRYRSCGCRVCQSSPSFGVNASGFKMLFLSWPAELHLTGVR